MKLNQLNALLDANRNKRFLLQLPDQKNVPVSFHVTEVGHVSKKFIDCGGALHTTQSCQLQVWVGEDHAQWLAPEKGALGMDALRALKDRLDPHDVLNPGKLLT